MTTPTGDPWRHEHVYLGEAHEANERRTWVVVGLTAATMVAEIAAGSIFNSMALLADGWHMATHAGALGISAFAYRYARRHARDPRFAFGTGKVGDLAGYTSAVVLGVVALLIAGEAVDRLRAPLPISFDEAIAVAVLGLAVNVASALVLARGHGHRHRDRDPDPDLDRDRDRGPDPDRDRDRDLDPGPGPGPGHGHGHGHARDPADHRGHVHARGAEGHAHADHNLRSAYLHVLADALTSVLAIAALVLGRWAGAVWLDPVMGLVGALVIARWAVHLLRDTGRVLLDFAAAERSAEAIRRAIEEREGDRLSDLHVWRVGPGHVAAIVSVVSAHGATADDVRAALGGVSGLAHLTVEVRRGAG
ncbi:MAG TPA: cation diffusion facilitator family transporter [Anaeromyxobacter sp.]|nr:cation diffusion facilitator family transporter [Anaeromyxobacter sp.]